MAPDQVPSSERHIHISPQPVLECLKEANIDGFFPGYFDPEGRNSFCSASILVGPATFGVPWLVEVSLSVAASLST